MVEQLAGLWQAAIDYLRETWRVLIEVNSACYDVTQDRKRVVEKDRRKKRKSRPKPSI